MKIEYEATFTNINKDVMRAKLETSGASLIRPEYLQKRAVFELPKGNEIKGGWLRVRDEGDRITLTLKVVRGAGIESQKEILLEVNDFDQAERLLTMIGCRKTAYQESRRELWKLDGAEITLDEWPFLEPLVEIEGNSEDQVKDIAARLGFSYENALFGTVSALYDKKYGLSKDIFNNIPKIIFDMENPFISKAAE